MMNMKLLAVVTPPSIYHGCSTHKTFWEVKFKFGEFTAVNMKIVVIVMLGNTERSRVVASMSPWTSLWNLTVWTIWESHLHIQKIIWEGQERGWLPLWVSRPNQGQRNTKSQGMTLEISVRKIFQRLLGSLKIYLMKVMRERGPNMSLLTVTFTYQDSLQSVWWDLMTSTRMFTL